MAVNIIVEDGTGKSGATSYVSIAEFKAYWNQKGVTTYDSTADDTLAVWLNEATLLADSYFCYGGVIYSTEQALQVPRLNWYDRNGNSLDGTVPTQLKNAISELAAERQGTTVTKETDGIKRKTVGPLTVEYRGGGGSSVSYPSADIYMIGLLCSVSSGSIALPR